MPRGEAARRWRAPLGAVAAGWLIAVAAGAAPPGNELRVNPFIRPVLSAAAPPPEAPVQEERAVPPTDLRFTLAAGEQSLVRVDGAVMRVGDELNGYRLERVGEGVAVFSRKGESMTVRVHDDDASPPGSEKPVTR